MELLLQKPEQKSNGPSKLLGLVKFLTNFIGLTVSLF